MIIKNRVQKIIDTLLLVILAVFPLMINVALISPKDTIHPLVSVNISIADLFIGIVLVLWVIKIIVFNQVKQVKLPPHPILIFIGIGAISVINAFSITNWLKDMIQFIEYFFFFYILLLNNLQSIKLSTLKNILFIAAACIVMIALIQHAVLNGSSYLIRGVFENRGLLGSYLCMIIPLVYADFLYTKNIYRKIWLACILIVSLLILTSGSAFLSIMLGLFTISILRSKKTLYHYLIGLILIAVVYPFIMPQKNINEIKDFCSIYEQGKISENYFRQLTILYDLRKDIILNKKVGKNSLVISNDLCMPSVLPEIRKGDRYKEMDEHKHIKQRYLEMQAALNLMGRNTLLGVGLGNYQQNIGSNYGELPKVNTAEPNQLNGFLIIGSTTGILGLAAFWGILLYAVRINYSKLRNPMLKIKHPELCLGLIGSIVACIIENCFSLILVAGLLVPFIFIVYLSAKEDTNHE